MSLKNILNTKKEREINNHQAKMKQAVAVKVVSDIPKFNGAREQRQHRFS
jgi:hypothetical protein